MPKLIEFTTREDSTLAVTIDGRPQDSPQWSTNDQLGMPFAGVYLAGDRVYDVEVWWDGELVAVVPPKSAAVDLVYDAIEGAQAPSLPRAPRGSDPDWKDRLDALRAEMDTDPGVAILRHWYGLQRTLRVHDANRADLELILDRLSTDSNLAIEMMQNTRPPVVREQVDALIDQRLHNYVASAMTLVDHSRRLLRRYQGSKLWQEYEQRRAAISTGGLSLFIRGLRNYALHRELPFVGGSVSLSVQDGSATATMLLNTESLLEWDKWDAGARRFIEASGKTIDLLALVREHSELVETLYQWLLKQADRAHRYEVELYNELREEFNWTLSGGREGRPRRFRPHRA